MWSTKKKQKRFIIISLCLHLSLFLFLLVNDVFFPSDAKLFVPTVQIDMVALPDQVKSQDNTVNTSLPVKENPPPPPEKEEPEPEPVKTKAPEPQAMKKPDELAIKKKKETEKQAKSALDKVREKLEKEREEAEKKKQEQIEKRKSVLKKFEEKYRSAIKGNQKNQGTSATGAMEATINAYAGHITEVLRENWSLPVYLQGKGLRAVARIYINSSGAVERFLMIQSSGNEVFDDYVKKAVNQSRFMPPPEEWAKDLRNRGLEVLFPL